ncbi:MAG TPA: chemotaxis protein CheX [Acetobacteraceae bacterium]|nr:chemotaxis protein CheX [Acetobacteraceae bacterium]
MSDDAVDLLDEMERDALTELVNLGVSRAAGSLRVMVRQEILLSVPGVAIVPRSRAARMIGGKLATNLVAVCQDFDGDISGRALLIFPETKSLDLVRTITGGELPLEEIVALEHEALAETGNIILNNCLATIANTLRRTLRMSLPAIFRGDGGELFGLSAAADDLVLVLYINFTMNHRDITGYIAMLMDLPALRELQTLLRDLVLRVSEFPLKSHVTS